MFWNDQKTDLVVLDEDGLAVDCDCCPCPGPYYISTYCPCQLCGPAPECKLGSKEFYTSDEEDPFFDEYMANKGVTDGTETIYSFDLQDGRINWCSIIGLNCKIQSVRLTTRPAPLSGTCTVAIKFNGYTYGTWEGNCIQDDPCVVGNFDWGDGALTHLVRLYKDGEYLRFTTTGWNRLSIQITYDNGGGAVIVDNGVWNMFVYGGALDGELIGSLWVSTRFDMADVKGLLDDGRPPCPYWRVSDYTPLNNVQIRGPYDTRAEAQFVLTTWGATLLHWASRCVCRGDCTRREMNNTAQMINGGWPEGWLSDFGGQGEDEPSPGGCDDQWLEYKNWGVAAGYDEKLYRLEARMYCDGQDGDYDVIAAINSPETPESPETSWNLSGLVPPCCDLQLWIVSLDESFPALNDNGPVSTSGTANALGYPDPCELTDEDIVWNTDTGTGIPGTTEELNDYLENWA